MILQRLVDANCRFINMVVGAYGKQSDGETLRFSALFLYMSDERLKRSNASDIS